MYSLILLLSDKNSVRQRAISEKPTLFFRCIPLALLLTATIGVSYGIFQKYQRTKVEKELQANAENIKQLGQTKNRIELELAAVNEEMEGIRWMTAKIQEVLGILGQGGGSDNTDWLSEGAEGQIQLPQGGPASVPDALTELERTRASLTPDILKQEVQPLYDSVRAQQKQIDGYPSILPVELEKADGEKHVFWYSSGFGWRTHPLTGKREFHRGLDIKTRAGIPVVAAADGTILKAERSGYLGKTIEIAHEARQFKTLYAHLKDYADGLKVGQKVKRGQIIGYVGNTGRSTGAHLHYGVYDTNKKAWVNPFAYILDQQPTFSP